MSDVEWNARLDFADRHLAAGAWG